MRVAEQRVALNQKLRGHYNYYGVIGNARAICGFRRQVERLWRKWLSRRSRAAPPPLGVFRHLLQYHSLEHTRVVHSVYRCVANP